MVAEHKSPATIALYERGVRSFLSWAEFKSAVPELNRATATHFVADLLATKTAGLAANHGFDFVDPRAAFNVHRICDDVEWLNGLSNPVGESYHPNRLGHDGFTDLIAARL